MSDRKEHGVIGYMCTIDYEYELGRASGGNTIYPTLEDLKKHHSMWNECGVVEVKVIFVKNVVQTNGWGMK